MLAVPGGTREILAENLIAAWLDLEVASGNDAIASHSPTRRTAKLMGQFLPGTDFVTSGYSVMPRHDNMFGGGNYDADDLDEWLTLQRDWQVDAGIEPAGEDDVLAVRERAAPRDPGGVRRLGFPPVTDAEIDGGDAGDSSRDLPDRDRAADVLAADRVLAEGITAAEVALALDAAGSRDVAEASSACSASASLRTTCRPRPSSTPTGRPLGRQRPQRLPRARYGLPARGRALGAPAGAPARRRPSRTRLVDAGRRPGAARDRRRGARRGTPDEVVVAVGPAFGDAILETINGLPHGDVLAAVCEGIREGGGDAAARPGAADRRRCVHRPRGSETRRDRASPSASSRRARR